MLGGSLVEREEERNRLSAGEVSSLPGSKLPSKLRRLRLLVALETEGVAEGQRAPRRDKALNRALGQVEQQALAGAAQPRLGRTGAGKREGEASVRDDALLAKDGKQAGEGIVRLSVRLALRLGRLLAVLPIGPPRRRRRLCRGFGRAGG